MIEERSFKRKAFGGFDREDVIEYIDELLAELQKCREENARKDARITELEERLDEYEATAVTQPEITADCSSPEDVLSQVDKILQSYLNKGE
ncbi:MAG: DivIVA domain-containing protein [Clostridia bacterium]|nr:DivIVA domain-containing protein [Clostridia bacterium]